MKSDKFENLQVGKGGLPPLFGIELLYSKSGGKPPFLTCEFMIVEIYPSGRVVL
jgi:hypothetical protein